MLHRLDERAAREGDDWSAAGERLACDQRTGLGGERGNEHATRRRAEAALAGEADRADEAAPRIERVCDLVGEMALVGFVRIERTGDDERSASALCRFDGKMHALLGADAAEKEGEAALGVAAAAERLDRHAVFDRREQRRARRAGAVRSGGDAVDPGVGPGRAERLGRYQSGGKCSVASTGGPGGGG